MRELLVHLLKGHAPAVDLCLTVFGWMNDYDHITDGDIDEQEDTLHRMVWAMVVDMPRNPFYYAYQGELSVTLANAISTWRASTDLQRQGDDKALELAHVMRWIPAEFFLHCARLVGGPDWATEQAPAFWRAMTQDHSFAEFQAESQGS